MPAFNIRGLLLNELNNRNSQTLTEADVGFGLPYARDNTNRAKIQLTALTTGGVPNAGQAVATYTQLHLDTVFAVIGRKVTVAAGGSVHAILGSLRRYTGLDIKTTDVEDTALSWNNNTATVTLRALSGSRTWVGSTNLTLTLEPQVLAALFTNLVVDVSSEAVVTPEAVMAAANRLNSVYVPFTALDVGVPSAVSGDGYNTQLTIAAKPNSGYVGVVTLHYTRRTIVSVFGSTINVLEDVSTAWDLLPYLVALKGDIITPEDVQDTPVVYTDPPSVNTVSATEHSWTYAGDSALLILRRSDATQKITVNLLSDDLAYTQTKLQQAIVAQDNGEPYADITINVAKNITIVGASSTVATLVLDNYGTIKQTNWYINNQGSIYGRGGDGGGTTGYAGKAGGDAINNVSIDNPVVIDNQGRIAGGGGGGAGHDASGRIGRGGGGVPFGVSGNGITGTATQTNYTAGSTASEYPIRVTGGAGGFPGMAGGNAIQTMTSNGATSVVRTGGAAGAVIVGQTEVVSWKRRGIQMPFRSDITIPAFSISSSYPGTPTHVYMDPADSSKIVVNFGYVSPPEITPARIQNEVGVGGTQNTSANIQTWVVYIDGRWVLVPLLPKITGIAWNELYNAGVVYGDNTVGQTPPDGAGVNQFRLMRLASELYSVRLFQGANVDPIPGGTDSYGVDKATTVNSEWDRIMYLLVSGVDTSATQPGIKWTSFGESTWGLAAETAGSFNWTKERHNYDGTDRRALRGGGNSSTDTAGTGVRRLGAGLATATDAPYGWRPVFEHVRKIDMTEYTRFVDWLATNPSTVSKQLTAMSATPYATNNAQVSAGNGTIYDQLIALTLAPGQSSMYGSPYKALFSDVSYWGNIFDHALPHYNLWDWLRTNAPMALAYIKTNPKAALTGIARNLLASANGTTSNSTTYSLSMTQIVYFDPYLGRMMQWSPYAGDTPTEFFFWTGDKVALSSLVTKPTMGTFAADTTDQNFLARVGTFNSVTFAPRELMFSNPVEHTGPEGNTKVTLTAVEGGRYTGSVDVYFTRVAFADRNVPQQRVSPDVLAFTGTVYEYLSKYLPTLIPTYFSDLPVSAYTTRFTVMPNANPPTTLTIEGVSRYVYITQPTISLTQSTPVYSGTATALSSLVTSTSLGTVAIDTTDQNFVNRIPVNTPAKLDPQWVSVSDISDSTDVKGNSKVTVTAVANGPYTGSIDVYFDRTAFATGTPPTALYKFADTTAFTGTEYEYLSKYFPDVLTTYYPDRPREQFDTTVFTVAAGDLPTLSIFARPANRWAFKGAPAMVVNPATANWEGDNLVMGFNSDQYVQGGFTDKAGNTIRGYNQYAGTAGNYPVKANLGFVFGSGLQLRNSMISTVNALPATTFSEPFTVDFWQYYPSAPAAGALPLNPVYAAVNTSAFNAAVRFQIGDANSTSNIMAVWNNAANPKLNVSPNSAYRRAGWQHIAITYDGSVFRFYQDGALLLTSATLAIVGGGWQLSLFGTLLSGISGSVERYRFRKGVKLAAGYTVSDLYPGS